MFAVFLIKDYIYIYLQMNREADEQEVLAAPQNNTEANLPPKSPMSPSRKGVVQELAKRADGSFVATSVVDDVPSPRTVRANRAKVPNQKVMFLI